MDKEELKGLQFVLRYYSPGIFDTRKALRRYKEAMAPICIWDCCLCCNMPIYCILSYVGERISCLLIFLC